METRGFLSTDFNTKTISDDIAELGSQVVGVKGSANKNSIDENTYRDRVATTLVMFHEDMDEDDSNELSAIN